MVITGVNCTVTYFALKGNFKCLINNEEFKYYSLAAVGSSIMVFILIYTLNDYSISSKLTEGFFMVLAIGTSTGFVTADYTTWTPVVTVILFCLIFMGDSAGSRSGGVKVVRHLTILKNSILELKKLIHPSAIIPVELNNKAVSNEIVFNVFSFFYCT